MKTLMIVVAAACGSGSPITNQRLEPLPSAASRAEAAREAELRVDYRRPMIEPTFRAAGLYLDACRAGHAQSCWLAMTLASNEEFPAIAEMVRANCRRGHALSCRAVPKKVKTRSDLESGALELCHADCDEHKTRQLLDGCRKGLYVECIALRSWDRPHIGVVRPHEVVASREMCKFSLDACYHLYGVHVDLGDRIGQRDALEIICQRGHSCSALVDSYRWGSFPEPYPGRKDELISWLCKNDRLYAEFTLCGGTVPPPPQPRRR